MDWVVCFDQRAAAELPDVRIEREVPMNRHTSFRVGGPARRMAFPSSPEQLEKVYRLGCSCGTDPFVLGRGTNLMVADEGLNRLVIATEGLNQLEPGEESDTLKAEAGVSLARLAEFAAKRSLTGLEFAHGIPGSVGGAVCMNAGAYDGTMKDVLKGAAILFPQEGVRYLSCEELELGYRHSILTDHPEAVVLYAEFCLQKGDEQAIRGKMRDLMGRRKASQPLEYPSAGSFFKRPAGYFAGALIQQCGLKGFTVGGAQVSEKHAGFVINIGNATCADLMALCEQVQQRVYEETGVHLEREVKLIQSAGDPI